MLLLIMYTCIYHDVDVRNSIDIAFSHCVDCLIVTHTITIGFHVQPDRGYADVTKVPKFAGETSWEHYRQVFDAIVQSNGWDDATAALQLLSHL